MAEITDLNCVNFQDTIEAAEKPLLVDFWAEWCGPCRAMAPVLEKIAEEEAALLDVARVNVDENRGLATQFNIVSIPTLILFKDGEPVATCVGAMPKELVMNECGPFL